MSSTSRSIPPVDKTTLSTPTSFNRNLAALTTRYVYPSDCKNRWLVTDPGAAFVDVYSAVTMGTSTDSHWQACQPLGLSQSYSPGVCPEEFLLLFIWETQYPSGSSLATRWEGKCCTSWLDIYDYAKNGCWGTISSTIPAFAPLTSIYTFGTSTSLSVFWSGSREPSITTLLSGSAMADPLKVAWESSDLAKFPPDYAVSLAKRIGVDFTPTPAPGSSAALSTGAKAGIGVGVALGALLVIGLIAAVLLIRRRKTRAEAVTNHDTSNETPEMEDQDRELGKRKWFLGGNWRSEAEVEHKPNELDSRAVHVVPGPPAELDAVEYRTTEEGVERRP